MNSSFSMRRSAFLAATSAALAAVSAGERLPAQAQTSTGIHIGIPPIDNAAEVYYAKELGYFAKVGMDATIEPLQNVSAIAAAIASNAVDFGFVTLDVLATTRQKNIQLAVIAPAAEYVSPATEGTAALVVPANSALRVAKDLNGKLIAVPGLHLLGEISVRLWLDQNGGNSSAAKFVEMPFPAMPAALEANRVDAAFIVEPYVNAAKNVRVVAYSYDAIAKHFIIAAWCATPTWAADHPDIVSRFAAAIHESAIWANNNQAQSGRILSKYTGIDAGTIATMARTRYAEQMNATLMQPPVNTSAKYNGFDPFPAQELVYVPAH